VVAKLFRNLKMCPFWRRKEEALILYSDALTIGIKIH
jgi:hypothetical protein